MFIDCFSGDAVDLRGNQRTPMAVLKVLEKNPRLSTWDMGETPWLRGCIDKLLQLNLIAYADEPYPWHRWTLTESGKAALAGS